MLERYGRLAWWACQGDALPPFQIAASYGMTLAATAHMIDCVLGLLADPQPCGDKVARTVYIVQQLAAGERMTTRRIADECQTTRQTAYNSLVRLARILPIYPDDGYEWQVCEMAEMV